MTSRITLDMFYKIDDLINIVKEKKDREAIYMVYLPKNSPDLHKGMMVYIGNVPDFDENDNEVFPESVMALGLETAYLREHFEDVVDLAYRQKATASIEDVIRCLNHYAEYDDFLNLY